MNRLHQLPILLISILPVACGKAPDSPGSGTDSSVKPVSASAMPPAPSPGSAGALKPGTPLPGPPLSAIPGYLKTAAYEYYGLGNPKPLDMQLTDSLKPGVSTGSQITTLKSVSADQAVFKVEHTGGLSALGVQELSLRRDGIYIEKSSMGEEDSNKLELPTDLSPGKSWTDHEKLTDKGVDINCTAKVVGVRQITTKIGRRTSLLLTLAGAGTINGSKASISVQTWYAKGIGMVKAVITTSLPGGAKEIQTLEESK